MDTDEREQWIRGPASTVYLRARQGRINRRHAAEAHRRLAEIKARQRGR